MTTAPSRPSIRRRTRLWSCASCASRAAVSASPGRATAACGPRRHDIVVFLDADLVAAEDLIAAHARWHHAVADAVTLGFCRYVSAADVDPAAVRAAANLAGLFAGRPFDFPWTERHMARTGDLTAPRDDLFRAVVGNNIGVRRAFFDEIGGFDEAFDRYGWEDTEFGYRAETRAAVLVPERAAMAWHQGRFAPNRGPGKRHAVAAQRALGARLIAHPDFRADGGAAGRRAAHGRADRCRSRRRVPGRRHRRTGARR